MTKPFPNGMNPNSTRELSKLRCRRNTIRASMKKTIGNINAISDSTLSDEIELSRDMLNEWLRELKILNEAIHNKLEDTKYETNTAACEEREESTRLAVIRVRVLDHRNAAFDLTTASPISPDSPSFTGSNIPDIEKHVFLRGYLQGEAKRLVDGIAITAGTYAETKARLLKKYGDKNRIIQAHIDYLEGLQPLICPTATELNDLFVECNNRVHALKALGEPISHYRRILTPKILRAFPDSLCERWLIHVRHKGTHESDLELLLKFVRDKIDGITTAATIHGTQDQFLTREEPQATAATLAVQTRNKSTGRNTKGRGSSYPPCAFCNSFLHFSSDCALLTNLRKRAEKLRETNCCFLCLGQNHTTHNCPRCEHNHHVSICEADPTQTHMTVAANRPTPPMTQPPTSALGFALSTISTSQATVCKIDVHSDFTYLQTARVWVHGAKGTARQVRCVLDPGSQRSFVGTPLIDSLELVVIGYEPLAIQAFESDASTYTSRRRVRLSLSSYVSRFATSLIAAESSNTYLPHPTVSQFAYPVREMPPLELADLQQESCDLPIEILIGSDFYWRFVKTKSPIRINGTLTLVPSHFGWILNGNRTNVSIHPVQVNSITTPSDPILRSMWDLDTLGIRELEEKSLIVHDAHLLDGFRQSFRIKRGRAEIHLPWKQNIRLTDTNRTTALRRFETLRRRFSKDIEFSNMYTCHMLNYFSNGYVERLMNKQHYNRPTTCHITQQSEVNTTFPNGVSYLMLLLM
ncbi:uncharacterized protein LOC111617205 [Centruroides sculpturatus]|uniref:uncharacterized protein LOC111617205 n=1 Tax=Centruroides sculpturatus TaxID=218467 RepID=UPI000C6DF545|nr:uncharacterized protein LOC111617205 [Centruroides sculpturatus]